MPQHVCLVVGAGLSGAVFVNAAKHTDKSILVIDRRARYRRQDDLLRPHRRVLRL